MVADHYGLHDHRYVQGRCGTDINYLCCHLGLDIWQPAIHRNLIAHAHRGRHLRGILLQRHAVWPILIKLIPWIAIGVIFAAWFGHRIDDQLFKRMMAGIILLSVGALFYWEKKPLARIPSHWAVSSVMGLATGFTSMIGNLAGGFSNIYFISMRVLKDNFIGTAAWMFFFTQSF